MNASYQLRGLKGLWWEAEEYLRWPPLLAEAGYNFFMLCYTFCTETSLLWRHPLREPEESTIRELARSSSEPGIELCMAIHPFIGSQAWPPDQAGLHFHPTSGPEWFRRYWSSRRADDLPPSDPPLRYGSLEDLSAIVDKCQRAMQLGVRTFALCLDDIRTDRGIERFSSLAEAQVWLVTELWRSLRAVDSAARLLVAPTYYWTQAMDANPEYVATLARGLPPEIDVFWTGEEVRSHGIRARQAREATMRLGRKPVVWYNYASNDSFRFQLQFPPDRPPSSDLAPEVAGLMVNPMRQANLTRLHALVMGEYLTDPEHYDHQAAIERAERRIVPEEAVAALARFVSVWETYPDPRTLSSRLTEESEPYLQTLVANLEHADAALDSIVPALDRHLQDRAMFAEITDGAQRLQLLYQALRLRQQGQEHGSIALTSSRQALEGQLAEVSDDTACDARVVLETPLTF